MIDAIYVCANELDDIHLPEGIHTSDCYSILLGTSKILFNVANGYTCFKRYTYR